MGSSAVPTSRRVVPHAARWSQRWAAGLIHALTRAVAGTLRFEWQDHSGLHEPGGSEPAIYCIWHNRLALAMRIQGSYVRPRKNSAGLAALVSASKDGALLACVLESFQVQPVRGSSSRRGPQALLELTSWADKGYDLAITPDGPRGPCYVIQEGITSLAQLTGLPIIPVSCELQWKICLKSWDRFQVPLPFSRCRTTFGLPVRIPREASDADRERARAELQEEMQRLARD